MKQNTLLAALLLAAAWSAHGGEPVQAFVDKDHAGLGDASISLQWDLRGPGMGRLWIDDHVNHRKLPVDQALVVEMAAGARLDASALHLKAAPRVEMLEADPRSASLVGRLSGKALVADLVDPDGRLDLELRWIQRDGAHYLREVATLTALQHDQPVRRITLLQIPSSDAYVAGSVRGSPVVDGPDYLGFEHPLSSSAVHQGTVQLWIDRHLPLLEGQSITYSAVFGVTHPGQLRRDFLAYLERERAHPYRSFLHYNSWYDIGYFTPYTEAQALDRIHAFGEQLVRRRGVVMDSFLFDDGWDDRSGAWNFSRDFPHGFLPLKEAAQAYGAAPGVWLSPWGGYAKPKQQRVAGGRARGYEIIDGGLALSGPRYYQRFHDVTLDLVRRQGINQFKFDGTGNADQVFPGSRFDSDFGAAIQLIGDLRRARPDLYINLTTGTTPSPFWLRYADSIWRGGEDDMLEGVGSKREQWITYRDQQTYQNIVQQGPLFPLSALMLHGIIYARMNRNLATDPGHDFANEVHSFFGSGTQLQELYITPSLLSDADWDVLAQAAKWSRAHADVLKDTHWIGGDPGKLQVYGWAAWAPREGIITLRNPSERPAPFDLNLSRALQLPPAAARYYRVDRLWGGTADQLPQVMDATAVLRLTLQPFEVLTLELLPEG
ncbi:enterotoxin [Frateuria aurantia]